MALLFPLDAFELSATTQQAMDTVVGNVFNCRFQEAYLQADSIYRRDPVSPLAPFLLLFVVGLRDLDCGGNTCDPAGFVRSYQRSISSITEYEQKYGRTSYSVMLLGFSQAANASFYLGRQNYLAAMQSGFDALKNLQYAKELDSTNYDVDFFLGLYGYARAELKKRMWWVLFWDGGDKTSGIQKLITCSRNGRFTASAASLALSDLYIREGRYDQSRELLKRMQNGYPASRFVLWKRAKWHEGRQEYAVAAAVYEELAQSYEHDCPACYNALYTRSRQAHLLEQSRQYQKAATLCEYILEKYQPDLSTRNLIKDTRALLKRITRK